MSVRLAIGLGNMGARYDKTRHNVGMEAVARIAKSFGGSFTRNKYCAAYLCKAQVCGRDVVFAAAEGYMNESGINLAGILKFLKLDISETAVFYDDITIESGRFKLSEGGSAGGHNGVANIMAVCGNSFARVRIGLGGKPFKSMDLADYVLGRLTPAEAANFDSALPDIGAAFGMIVSKGLAAAQNVFNADRGAREGPQQGGPFGS